MRLALLAHWPAMVEVEVVVVEEEEVEVVEALPVEMEVKLDVLDCSY